MEKGHYSILRVSHLSQIDNFSIEQQKESIETYARFHSIEITEHLAECGSGTTDERKQIQTLYRLIEEDKVEGILCYKLDRIFRNMKLSIDFISTCVEKGIKIHSVAENISTDTPAGMFMVNCLLSVNQYAVDNIRSLVKGGLNTMAKSGLKATGSVYGYERAEAAFPAGLIERFVHVATEPGDVVLDPFTGSSTTGIAATQSGCYFVGYETNPSFVQLSHERLDIPLASTG